LEKGGFAQTNVDGTPAATSETGYTHFHGHLVVVIFSDHHSLNWYQDYLGKLIADSLQQAADGLKGPPPDMAGIPAKLGGPVTLDAQGQLIFTGRTGGMTHARRVPATAATTVELFMIRQRIGTTPTPLRIRLTPAGSEALANLRGSATVKMTSTLTPAAGPATTRSSTFELQSRSAPSSSSGAITSLTVAGSTADPTFVVR